MQHDLLPRALFSITPEPGRVHPRLWVRRLVIWRERASVIRSIDLRPGLNIVWSPDPRTSGSAPIGHGGGKTMFCRFLRYCLGEDSFAPEGQRLSIWNRFPDGHVGAEVIVDGQLWVVVRALATQRGDKVIRGGSLDQAVQEDVAPTGIGPLREAISQVIIGDAAQLMPPAIGGAAAWEAALAWATRDQECRFAHHLEWRDPHTDSRNPIRGRSMDDRLAVVRALIGALTTDEVALQARESEDDKKEKELQAKLNQLDLQIERARAELASVLGGDHNAPAGLALEAAHFATTAAERLAAALKLPPGSRVTELDGARSARDQTANDLRQLEAKLAEIAVRIEEKNKTLGYMRGELPEARARLTREGSPVCPICEVPIDRALAEGCGISTAACDLNALQARIEALKENVEREQNAIRSLREQEPKIQSQIALARQRLKPLEEAVTRLEQSLLDQSTAIRTARRLVDDAERYQSLLSEQAKVAESLDQAARRLKGVRGRLAAHRDAAGEAIRHLSTRFDGVIHELIPGDITGEAKLDGKGLSLKVELGGERSTAAIESLKVVAFDLAALSMTIEGRTRLPGLLVHDSPREADLGASIYGRVFAFARKLEGYGSIPLFQYIITTTTEPPEELRSAEWTRLIVQGAPAEERLLRVNL